MREAGPRANPLRRLPSHGGAPGDDAPIVTRSLTKRFGPTTALAELSLRVPRGTIFALLGPNGAGKTTAMKLLLGLARPTSGSAWVLGAPLGDARTRRRIGYLPELFRFPAWLRVRDVLALHCRLALLPAARWDGEIRSVLGIAGLADRAGDRVGTLSKGLQQRLGLAVALLAAPELVFLDEPTSALDPAGRHEVRGILRDLKARGTTVVLNTHLLSEAEQVCDHLAILNRGRVVASGSLSEVLGPDALRLQVTGLGAGRHELSRFGSVEEQGEWIVVRGAARTRVP